MAENKIDVLNGKIRVYNYELSPTGFPSQHNQQGVFIRGRDEEEEFVVERVALDDVEIENTKSDLFKVGRLRFHPEEEDEIYLKLGIEDRENIMNDKELDALLMSDSIENVKRISNIKSSTLISRMKTRLFVLERAGRTPSHRIIAVVSERNSELINGGKRNPNSEINKIIEMEKQQKKEESALLKLDELTRKVTTLEKESKEKDQIIEKSQTAIEELLKKVDTLVGNSVTVNADESKDVTEATKRPVGRPPRK